jgi:hypothetical protein
MSEFNPKIGNIGRTTPIESGTKQNKALQKGSDLFNQILTDQVEKNNGTMPTDKAPSLPEIGGTFRAQNINFPPSPDTNMLSKKLEASLSMLDRYASWLGDPDKSAKESHNLLEQAISQTKAMGNDFKNDISSSDDLKQIFNQLMTTLEVEQVKFDRGDYTTPVI